MQMVAGKIAELPVVGYQQFGQCKLFEKNRQIDEIAPQAAVGDRIKFHGAQIKQTGNPNSLIFFCWGN
mgnify:CR=1 FL=1